MYVYIKRFLDIILGILGLVFLVPLYLIIFIIYLCTGDMRHILYKQTRVGQDGKLFDIYKFRTMVVNAEDQLGNLIKDDRYRMEWEQSQKIKEDPRVTRIGKFLRKASLDEWPQFINVLKGDMSLIGPRPLVEGELEAHGGSKLYWQVKPGITGWWASHGRSNMDYDKRLEMEYYYVRNCSLKLDLICLFKTIGSVLRCEGAE